MRSWLICTIAWRAGGTTDRTTPTANTAAPTAKAGRSIASRQSRGRRARYLGTRKNLFDLRRVAVVHNLHVIARQPDDGEYQLAA